MAKKKGTKGRAKRARGTKAAAPRKARAKKASAKGTGSITGAASAVASTVMDRLRAWSPSRYTTR